MGRLLIVIPTITTGLVVAIAGGIYALSYHQHQRYFFDAGFSAEAALCCKAALANGFDKEKLSVTAQKNTIIQDIHLHQADLTHQIIEFSSRHPWLLINDKAVLSKDGAVIARRLFDKERLEGLPSVQMSQVLTKQQYIPSALLSFLSAIDDLLFHQMQWFIASEDKIIARAADGAEIWLYAHDKSPSLSLQNSLFLLQSINQDIGKKKMLCDTRFEKQFILR